MQNLQNTLIEILKDDSTYTSEGKLLKNKLTEDAFKLEPILLKYLLLNGRLKKHFFVDVDGTLFFDKDKFVQFVNNKEFLPDSYTSFKNKIGLLDEDGKYFSEKRDVVLAWPYKDCVLEGGQEKEDQKRDEIFYNEVLAPDEIDRLFDLKVLTNFKSYDKDGEHGNPKDLSRNDNLIIKGNNLLALHSLKKLYRGKVKLIYIDPPYNTGNDSFRYNDKFNHSTWLTFMKNRLDAAKELLKDDGLLFIQIDNKELAYLKVSVDEVFSRDNFRNGIIVKKGTKSLQKQFDVIHQLNAGYDTILLYSKNSKTKIPNLFKILGNKASSSWNNHWRGTDRPTMRYPLFDIEPETGQWRWEKERTYQAVENYKTLINYIVENKVKQEEINDSIINKFYESYLQEHWILSHKDFELVRLSKNGRPEHYIPARSRILLSENWMDQSVAGRITEFEHEKNEEILQRVIEWITEENDLVMDYFLGSGTTCAVAHKLKRQYIGIEQLEYGENDSIVRLNKVINGDQTGISKSVDWKGGGSFVYAELRKWNQNYIDEIEEAKATEELFTIYEKMKAEAFFCYDVDLSKFDEKDFSKLELDQQKEILIKCLDKNHLYVNLSEMDDATYEISDEEKEMNRKFYGIG